MGYVCEEYMIKKECIEGIEDMKRNINFSLQKVVFLSKECVCVFVVYHFLVVK